MAGQDVTIESAGGERFNAYLAKPAELPAPGVIVLQEIFGVNPFIRTVADRLAAAGFLAIAPELYWRQQADIQLDPDNDADMGRAVEHLKLLDEEEALSDAESTLAYLRGSPDCTGRVGAIGFCLGGKLAYLMAARSGTDAGVAYYGTGLHHALDVAGSLRAPVLLHIAADDFLCPPDAQAQISARMDEVRPAVPTEIRVEVHPGAGHGFLRWGKKTFQAEAGERAEAQTRDFLHTHLVEPGPR